MSEQIEKIYYSPLNGKLFIHYDRKKKILDGENVNYSFGSVHKIWKDALKKVQLASIQNALLLGLGGGSVVELLQEAKYSGRLTAIELDPVMITIARKEFSYRNSDTLKIKCDDAFKFVASTRSVYDLIMVDVFIGSRVAPQLFKNEFWKDVDRITDSSSVLLLNMAIYADGGGKLDKLCQKLSKDYVVKKYSNIGGSNTFCG